MRKLLILLLIFPIFAHSQPYPAMELGLGKFSGEYGTYLICAGGYQIGYKWFNDVVHIYPEVYGNVAFSNNTMQYGAKLYVGGNIPYIFGELSGGIGIASVEDTIMGRIQLEMKRVNKPSYHLRWIAPFVDANLWLSGTYINQKNYYIGIGITRNLILK